MVILTASAVTAVQAITTHIKRPPLVRVSSRRPQSRALNWLNAACGRAGLGGPAQFMLDCRGDPYGHRCTEPGGMAPTGRSLRLLVFRLRVEIEFLVRCHGCVRHRSLRYWAASLSAAS